LAAFLVVVMMMMMMVVVVVVAPHGLGGRCVSALLTAFGRLCRLAAAIDFIFQKVDQRNLRGNWVTGYTCKGGGGAESWEPTFTYTGHRFIELHGHGWAEPTIATVAQRVMHADVESAPAPLGTQALPRTLAGSIAFGGTATTAPDIDGPQCWHGETCMAARPTGAAANTVSLCPSFFFAPRCFDSTVVLNRTPSTHP